MYKEDCSKGEKCFPDYFQDLLFQFFSLNETYRSGRGEDVGVSVSQTVLFQEESSEKVPPKGKNKTQSCNLGTGWYFPPPLDENMNVRPSFDFSKDVYILGFVQNLFLESDFSDVVGSVSILNISINSQFSS